MKKKSLRNYIRSVWVSSQTVSARIHLVFLIQDDKGSIVITDDVGQKEMSLSEEFEQTEAIEIFFSDENYFCQDQMVNSQNHFPVPRRCKDSDNNQTLRPLHIF